MRVFHWITGITLVVLLALAIAGLVLTRDLGQPSGDAEGARKPQNGKVVTANAASQTLADQRDCREKGRRRSCGENGRGHRRRPYQEVGGGSAITKRESRGPTRSCQGTA